MLLKHIANGLTGNYSDMHLMILLVANARKK